MNTALKIHIFLYTFLLSTVIIIVRMLHLQIINNDYFFIKSQQNFSRVEETAPTRGTIYDHNGVPLATNIPTFTLCWQGSGNRTLTDEQKKIVEIIHDYFGQDGELSTLVANIGRAEKLSVTLELFHRLSYRQLSKIMELFGKHPNIIIKTSVQRYYPFNNIASHLIGHLSRTQEGKMGLEKVLQSDLQGNSGCTLKIINSFGKQIERTQIQEALSGNNIYTTLDIYLQQIAQQVFPDTRKGALIVMNPLNGAILALTSKPDFDPTLFLHPLSTAEWQTLQQDHTFVNRAFCSYPPGSIFKLVTISAVLETGIIDLNTTWDCKGYSFFADRKYWCARREGHGVLTTKQALAQSCNFPFFEIGKQIDIDVLASYAHKFGLGEPTGILLHEQSGIVPSRLWKEQTKGERWWKGETLSASIGQSYLDATPIQIARMISSIFTGYLVRPRLLLSEPVEQKPLAIQPATIEFLKKSMKSVIKQGTGKRINTIKDLEIYAKTSTAQMSGLQKRRRGTEYFEHGWFVAHFNYKEQQPLVLVILVEHAGTSQVATTIAKNFLLSYKEMIDDRLG